MRDERRDAAEFFNTIDLSEAELGIADRLLHEIRSRLKFLIDVGLQYLTLNRLASTLSGGEAQRIQLATNLGASLVGALYVLDEPSIGLHPRDNAKLIAILKNLRDIGNTVLVVEHEPEMMFSSDKLIDIGPGAGELGGEVVFRAPSRCCCKRASPSPRSTSAANWKSSRQRIAGCSARAVEIRGASEHNLKGIDVDIPLGMMVCITGVSGSGKSTLVHDIIYAGIKKQRGEWTGPVGAFRRIDGAAYLDDVVLVDQSPIGRTPRSNPVTYIKVYDAIRDLFAATREALTHGFDSSHFSFNVPGGRCGALRRKRRRDKGNAVFGQRRTGLRRMQGPSFQTIVA